MIEIPMARFLELREMEKIVCESCKKIIRKRIDSTLDEMKEKFGEDFTMQEESK